MKAGKLPVPVPDQVARPAARVLEIHHEVLDGLRHPACGRMCGGAEDADTAVGVLDDGEDVLALPGQGDGLNKVAGEERFGSGAREVGPGGAASLGRGVDARGLEDLPDGGGGDLDTKGGKLAVYR